MLHRWLFFGLDASGQTIEVSTIENANRTSPDTYLTTFAGVDLSGYDSAVLYVNIVSANSNALDIQGVNAKLYYA